MLSAVSRGRCARVLFLAALCVPLVAPLAAVRAQSDFVRGDCNLDGSYNIADAVALLAFLFPNPPPPNPLVCPDACDANDDGSLDIADAVRMLGGLFSSPATPPAAPYPACGADPTADGLSCVGPIPQCVPPPPTAFRMSSLTLRDPHVFVGISIFCIDLTDTAFLGNPSINDLIAQALNGSTVTPGTLDLSYLLIFRPLDQAGASGTVDFAFGTCTAPVASTTCDLDLSGPVVPLSYTNQGAGTCLAPIAGTLQPYSPSVTPSTAPCFVTAPASLTLDLGGILVSLESAQLAGRYSGTPASQILSGLGYGFLSQAAANTIIIPASIAVVGGQPLSSLLPGGAGNCSTGDDRDLGPDGTTLGWWIYFNYSATQVPYLGP